MISLLSHLSVFALDFVFDSVFSCYTQLAFLSVRIIYLVRTFFSLTNKISRIMITNKVIKKWFCEQVVSAGITIRDYQDLREIKTAKIDGKKVIKLSCCAWCNGGYDRDYMCDYTIYIESIELHKNICSDGIEITLKGVGNLENYYGSYKKFSFEELNG